MMITALCETGLYSVSHVCIYQPIPSLMIIARRLRVAGRRLAVASATAASFYLYFFIYFFLKSGRLQPFINAITFDDSRQCSFIHHLCRHRAVRISMASVGVSGSCRGRRGFARPGATFYAVRHRRLAVEQLRGRR